MLTISKPLSAGQAQTYHREEFQNARENYYSEGETIRGEWHGKLAEQWGLRGEVNEEHFARLAQGQHPATGEQLVRHQAARKYTNASGDTVQSMEHRAGWDATFSAPKTVSLTALVGHDEQVREAHRASVQVALNELEGYVQARIGGSHAPETTGKWVAAKFEHDSARPVDGYAAPQLHTHVVFFNVTERENGEPRALQPQELYRTQQYATAVYRSELALRLKSLGYEIEQGRSGQPEIKGYTREYIEASSPRSQQIREHLEEAGVRGAGAAQIAAHQTREAKQDVPHAEMQQRHQDMAAQFGQQPQHVILEAHARQVAEPNPEQTHKSIDAALTYARERNLERQAVTDERELMRDTLKRSMGEASLSEVRSQFANRVQAGELIEIERDKSVPGRAYTTPEMIGQERDTINLMRAGQGQHEELVSFATRQRIESEHPHLSTSQHSAVEQVLSSRDQVTALEGMAGAGKTTSLAAIRAAAEREGYTVEGFAPTSRAAQKLEESGVKSSTLQHHLAHSDNGEARAEGRHLYIVDEASLASTKQVNEFLHRLDSQDRVLLVGDTRQHEAVEAGRPYQQLQEAGMQTARLDEIVRQKDPALKEAVEQLARGDVREAVNNLDRQGRVHEIEDRHERLTAIAHDYAARPEGTLVVSPDNESRRELNTLIHREMQERGVVGEDEHQVKVLQARQELTGADRQWASQYEPGDVLRYARGSKTLGIEAGEYARVERVDQARNLITIERDNGEHQTYDPRRLQGVTIYAQAERAISEGERVQFTSPSRDLHVANRELGTVEKIEDSGDLRIKTDSGRTVEFNIREHPHLDYGYAVTSHSSQGQTADRVLVHVDTEQGQQLVNSRMAYVSVSRGRYDAQIYTNDRSQLAHDLSRDVSQQTAIQPGHEPEAPAHAHKIETPQHGEAQAQGQGMST